MIGYAFCGSFCTLSQSLEQLESLVREGEEVLPIVSENVASLDTRFWKCREFVERVEEVCSRRAVRTIVEAEPLGPKTPLDALIIAPTTGNTLAKMAHGITDGVVTMAAKAHLRTDRPLLIALASNDAMSANLANIAKMLVRTSVYFVPMRQDDPVSKPHSLVCDFSRLAEAYVAMLHGHRLRPLFV